MSGEAKRFQINANLADEAIMKACADLSASGLTREEICAGALFATVRVHVRAAPKPASEASIFRVLIQATAATLRAVLEAEYPAEPSQGGS